MSNIVLTPFQETIKAHLDEVAKKDKQFAKSYVKENKSLAECEKYILQEVRNQAKGKTAVACSDDDIYNLAIHYYDEDDIKVSGSTPKVEVKHTPEKMEDYKKRTAPKRAAKKTKEVKVEDTDDYEPLSLEIPLFG